MGSDNGSACRKRSSLWIKTKKVGGGTSNGESTEDEAGEPLSPAARLFHEPHFNCYIIAMMGCGKKIDVDAIKAGLEVTLVRHPRFSSVMVNDSKYKKPRWVRTNVVVDNHIIVPNLNPQQTTDNSNEQLIEDYVASLSQTTLDFSRPLWDLHLINLSTAEAESVAILRIHHSLGDGVSLMSLFLACTRKTSDPESPPSLPGSQRRLTRSVHNRGRVFAIVMWAWALMVLALHTVVDAVLFVLTAAFLKDTDTPLMGVEGVEFHRKRFLHRTLSLDDVKVVKNAVGCTINDVLVGLTSAAFYRYLSRRYDVNSKVGKDEINKKSLPSNIRLRTTVLVNIRRTPGIHALAEMMAGGGDTRWGNRLGYLVLPFPVKMYEDPVDYVRKGMEIANRKKNSLEAIFTYTSGSLIVKFFGIKAAASLCYRVLRHTTVSFSNIVGPVEEIEFCGHPLVYLAPSVFGHPQAVTLHFQSYMDKMKIVLAVDEVTVPDPHQLLDDLTDSLKVIKDAIVARSS